MCAHENGGEVLTLTHLFIVVNGHEDADSEAAGKSGMLQYGTLTNSVSVKDSISKCLATDDWFGSMLSSCFSIMVTDLIH